LSVQAADLEARRSELMAPFAALDVMTFDPALLRAEICAPGGVGHRTAERIVEHSYAAHYRSALVEVPYHSPATSPTTEVLAAIQRTQGRDVVVGTIRCTWDEHLEVFDLFEVPAPAVWPHVAMRERFGELHKLAWHPVVDALAGARQAEVRAFGLRYRVAVFNALRRLFEPVLDAHGCPHVYYIASKPVHRFCRTAAYHSTRVDAAVPARSDSAGRLREEWWRYFRPDEPLERQPRVYQHPTR
jgi:hypothetical protein